MSQATALATKGRYYHRQHEAEPLKFFIALMGLQRFEKALKAEANALAILSGMVVYRGLHHHDQSRINRDILAISDQSLRGHLLGMVGLLSVQPYWFCWSLSDSELKAYFDQNDTISKLLSQLGLDVPTLTVASLAGCVRGL